MPLPRTKLLSMIAGLMSVAALGGCGGGEPDLVNGREAFIAQCAECHILSEARAGGRIGPDLDAAFAAARDAGMNDQTIEGIVASQISDPRFTDPEDPTYMPADLVTGDDLRDVAAYVGDVAGNPDVEVPPDPADPGGKVFIDQGCAACHSFAAAQAGGRVGPNLDTVLLGQTAAMIRESIIRPNAEISANYPAGIMPELYGSDISPEDLELLVSYLQDNLTRPGEGPADSVIGGDAARGDEEAGSGSSDG